MSKVIKTTDSITIDSPSVNFNVSNIGISPLTVNNANTKLVTQNSATNKLELVDSSTVSLKTDIQNIGGFTQLLKTAGIASLHEFRTLHSTTGSILLTQNTNDINLQSNITMSNTPGGGELVIAPLTGYSFSFKAILQSIGINVANNPTDVTIGLNPMTTSEIGGIYGSQRATEDNHIGFKNNVPDGSKSNVIASNMPSSLLGDSSNIMSSYINLSSANGTFSHSNVILSGTNSEMNSSSNTHVLGNSFLGTGLDMESSIYLGNLVNTKPTTVSTCINQNTFGNTIEMANNSWYIGAGRNNITLAPNEMHIDTACDRLYYHDLAAGSNTDILFYDTATGLITHENVSVLPPTPQVNLYNTNGSLTGNRVVTLGGFSITINGTGSCTINPSSSLTLDSTGSSILMGTSTALSTSIGRSGTTTTVNGNLTVGQTVTMTTATTNNALTSMIVRDTGTGALRVRDTSTLPSTNIYNTNGTLTSARTITLGTFSLTINGTGNVATSNTGTWTLNNVGNNSIANTGTLGITPSSTLTMDGTTVNIGTSTATTVSLSRASGICTINGAIVTPNITLDNTVNNILVKKDVTNQVFYRDATTLPNIYSSDGTLSDNRTINIPILKSLNITGVPTTGFNLTGVSTAVLTSGTTMDITGTVNLNLKSGPSGNINLGIGGLAGSINIGTPNVTNTFISGTRVYVGGDSALYMNTLIADVANTYLLYIDNISKQVTKAPIINDYANIRFNAQTSQTITATTTQLLTTGSAFAVTTSTNTSLDTNINIKYVGVLRRFRIIFTGNVAAAVTGQDIGIAIYINGIARGTSINKTQVPGAGTYCLNTCEIFELLNPNDLVSIGFSRSASDTTVTFTGNLTIQTLTLNNFA